MSNYIMPGCYLVVCYAPAGTSVADANKAFEEYIARKERGLIITHDHFLDCPGAYAIFFCQNISEVQHLSNTPELPGWAIAIHSLHFSRDLTKWLFQLDFTTYIHRDIRLDDLVAQYHKSPEYNRLSARKARGHLGPG